MARNNGRHRISRRTKIATIGLGLALAIGGIAVVTTAGDPGQASADLADKSLFVDITKQKPNVKQVNEQDDASTGTFTVDCGVNENEHFNPDNFIAAPGVKNGAQHLHDYVGNLTTNADSNNQSLQAGGTTCENGDKSAYFWPVIRIESAEEAAAEEAAQDEADQDENQDENADDNQQQNNQQQQNQQNQNNQQQNGQQQQQQQNNNADQDDADNADNVSNQQQQQGQSRNRNNLIQGNLAQNIQGNLAQNQNRDNDNQRNNNRNQNNNNNDDDDNAQAAQNAGQQNNNNQQNNNQDNNNQDNNQDDEDAAAPPEDLPGVNDQNELAGNDGEIVRPASAELTFRGSPTGDVDAMPKFLRILYGDAKVSTNGTKNARDSWTCAGFEDEVLINKYPICPDGAAVKRIHDFPSCWDGKNTDSANHRDHIVFPNENGQCKDGFKAVPQLRITLTYNIPQDVQQAGEYKVDSFPEEEHDPFTDHDDFANVMSNDIMKRVVNCINTGKTCNE